MFCVWDLCESFHFKVWDIFCIYKDSWRGSKGKQGDGDVSLLAGAFEEKEISRRRMYAKELWVQCCRAEIEEEGVEGERVFGEDSLIALRSERGIAKRRRKLARQGGRKCGFTCGPSLRAT